MQCFTTKSCGFTKILICMYSVHAARILGLSLEIILSPLKWGIKHLCNSKGYSSMSEQVSYFHFSEAKLINAFKDMLAGCKFWDLQWYFQVSDWILNLQWQTLGLYNSLLRQFSTSQFIHTNWCFFIFKQ